MRALDWWPVAIVAIGLSACLVVIVGAPLTVRAPVVFGFLLLCPGMAFVRLLRVQHASIELTLAIALSLTLDLLVSEGMALVGVWSAWRALGVLVLLAVAGAAPQMLLSGPDEPRVLEE